MLKLACGKALRLPARACPARASARQAAPRTRKHTANKGHEICTTSNHRREFISAGVGGPWQWRPASESSPRWQKLWRAQPIVSIVKIQNGKIAAAVEEAIDLLGGIVRVTQGKNRILLKPNLVIENRGCTTKWEVVAALARLMQGAGKEVSIGEGSVSTSATRCQDILTRMQQQVFDNLGYTSMARSLGTPLINLHSGPFVTVPLPDGLFWQELVLNQALVETDLLCSVAMMKTHGYATVTLSLKNAIGLYPGTIYGSYRWWVHDSAYLKKSPVWPEILDMVRVNKFGLAVIDGSTAMEGQRPNRWHADRNESIIAGTIRWRRTWLPPA
jgi:uncharacterized protein (DUF362 family)